MDALRRFAAIVIADFRERSRSTRFWVVLGAMGIATWWLFPPKEATQPIADAIPGAKAFLYESPLGHLGCALHIGKANDAIVRFIGEAERN